MPQHATAPLSPIQFHPVLGKSKLTAQIQLLNMNIGRSCKISIDTATAINNVDSKQFHMLSLSSQQFRKNFQMPSRLIRADGGQHLLSQQFPGGRRGCLWSCCQHTETAGFGVPPDPPLETLLAFYRYCTGPRSSWVIEVVIYSNLAMAQIY